MPTKDVEELKTDEIDVEAGDAWNEIDPVKVEVTIRSLIELDHKLRDGGSSLAHVITENARAILGANFVRSLLKD